MTIMTITRFIVLILLLVFSVTVVTYSNMGNFIFAGGSDTGLVVIKPAIWLMVLACLVITAGLLLAARWHSWMCVIGIVIVSLAIWLFCGRTVAITANNRIDAGWFFFCTNSIDFRPDGTDPEAYAARVRSVVLPGWRLRFTIIDRDATLFVGPVSLRPLIDLLRSRGFQIVDEGS